MAYPGDVGELTTTDGQNENSDEDSDTKSGEKENPPPGNYLG